MAIVCAGRPGTLFSRLQRLSWNSRPWKMDYLRKLGDFGLSVDNHGSSHLEAFHRSGCFLPTVLDDRAGRRLRHRSAFAAAAGFSRALPDSIEPKRDHSLDLVRHILHEQLHGHPHCESHWISAQYYGEHLFDGRVCVVHDRVVDPDESGG